MWNKSVWKALLMAGMMLAGCQPFEEDLIPETPEKQETEVETYTLSVKAFKGVGTKALWLGDSKLNAGWNSGEEVKVVRRGVEIGTLNVNPVSGNHSTQATLSGSIDGKYYLSENNVLTLLFPRSSWDYTGQNGALTGDGSIERMYDFSMTARTVLSISGSTLVTTSEVDFENQQSICRFSFTTGGNAVNVKQFTVSAASGELVKDRYWDADNSAWASHPGSLTVTPTAATTAPLYVSMRNELAGTPTPGQVAAKTILDTYSFTVFDSNNYCYLGSKPIPANALAENGLFLSAQNIAVTKVVMAQSSSTKDEVW